MTNTELIAELSKYPPDAEVWMFSNEVGSIKVGSSVAFEDPIADLAYGAVHLSEDA